MSCIQDWNALNFRVIIIYLYHINKTIKLKFVGKTMVLLVFDPIKEFGFELKVLNFKITNPKTTESVF